MYSKVWNNNLSVDKKLFQLNKKTISLVSEQKFNTV